MLVLVEFYNEFKENELFFEIVFVLFDKMVLDMEIYMKKCYGDWLVVLFGSEMI